MATLPCLVALSGTELPAQSGVCNAKRVQRLAAAVSNLYVYVSLFTYELTYLSVLLTFCWQHVTLVYKYGIWIRIK